MKTANEIAAEVTRNYYTRSFEWPISQFKELIAQAITEDRAEREREIEELKEENTKLREALSKCRSIFDDYVNLHLLKGTPEGNAKAEANAAMAALCEIALKENS